MLAAIVSGAANVWADVTVNMESDLRTAVQSSQTVTLGADIALSSGRLVIDNKTVTLNLNGHTLSRSLQAADADGQVVFLQNGGKLTITDKGDNSGRITGGWAFQGGGIFVGEDCELTISGGTISGNRADQIAKGGFGYGGGVENHGIMTMTGGVITGNTAGGAGAGIYQASTLNIQGNPVVDDLYLPSYQLITLTGALTTGASIGLDAQEVYQGNFTVNYKTYHDGTAPGTYFHSNNNFYAICLNASGEVIYGVKYIERAWDDTNKKVTTETKTCSSYTAINGNDDEDWVGLYNGWYVVTGNSNYKTLNVQGDDVHLIIPDMVTLTLTGGVKLETGKKLTIYSQGADVGQLTVTNSYSGGAGIGGGGENLGCGTLVIHGGLINATGGKNAAGIGGGYNAGIYGSVTIYGGTISATGGQCAAGIGGGYGGSQGGDITIYGGKLTVVGDRYAAGIGGGSDNHGGGGHSGNISIYGGEIKADSREYGAAIGAGFGGVQQENAVILIAGGTLDIHGGLNAAGIGGGSYRPLGGTGSQAGTIIISGGYLEVTGGERAAGIGSGAYEGTSGFQKNGGDITISGGELHIQGGTHGAGIGGGFRGCLNKLTITGGTIYAKGGYYGAGIGSAQETDTKEYVYGDVVISGGYVNATGGIAGAGIGGGRYLSGQHVTITGGTVEATAGGSNSYYSAAIGSGDENDDPGTLSIADHLNVKAGPKATEATYFSAAERIPVCLYRKYCYVSACTHSGATYTVSGATTEDTHTKHCAHCLTTFEAETHTFENGKCTVCGVEGTTYTVTVYVPKADTQTDGDYDTPISYQMVKDETFNLPPAPNTPEGMEFVGWVTGDVSHTSFITNGSETLIEAESEYTITADVTLTARYRYIDVILNDVYDNSEMLIYYNGMKAHSVKLFGRTLLKDGKWNTLCLPFDVTIAGSVLDGDNVEAKVFDNTSSLSDAGVLTLKFSAAPATITAGTPFIIKWNNTGVNLVNPVFTGVTINGTAAQEVVSTDTKVKFVGQYSPFSITDANINEILYVASGNKIGYSAGARTLKSCRAHFWVKPNGEAAARVINIDWGDSEQTGITTAQDSGLTVNSFGWYTLDGRKLAGKPTQKGVYINNGRKIVLK